MREWKTLNIISVLLLSAILTILQIDAAAANPLTRFSALLSLICAFMSLIYGCLYIIRFGTMRKTHKAAEWANESEKTSTSIFWNVWVMLAMPAVWLGWSMIFYIICIMSFVWQTGTISQPREYVSTDLNILIPRIVISCVLALGFIYLLLVAATFRRYSDPMEQAWQERIHGWLAEKAQAAAGYYRPHGYADPSGRRYDSRDEYMEKDMKAGAFSSNRSLGKEWKPHGKTRGKGGDYKSKSVFDRAPEFHELPPLGPQATTSAFMNAGAVQEGGEGGVKEGAEMLGASSVDPFVSFARVGVPLGGTSKVIQVAPPTPLPPSDSIEGLVDQGAEGSVQERRSNASRHRERFVTEQYAPRALPTQEGFSDRGLPRNIEDGTPPGSAKEVVAIPLKEPTPSEIEVNIMPRMEELYQFRRKTSVEGEGEEEGDSASIPIPGKLLDKGLASPTWDRFCQEIFSAWANVQHDEPRALQEMVEVVASWNGNLEPFDMFLALIQTESHTQEGTSTAQDTDLLSYTLYLGPKDSKRVGVRITDGKSRVSRLNLRSSGDLGGADELGYPEIIGVARDEEVTLF
ncbi:hypothetical protein NMY22_g3579 [Coprinellus aureogranulatus]|nr:hypothetical protein NMY22_g3579 [Coprinellus aureogranulatus]